MHFQLTKFLVLSNSSQQLHSDRETPLGRRAQEKPLPRNLFGYFFREKSKIISNSLLFWLGFLLLGGAALPTLGYLLTG
jgi:hypothetical protein